MSKNKDVKKFKALFDENNLNWDSNPCYSCMFLKAQQEYLNANLQVRGCVFLNEVYDALGFSRTRHGQIFGWTKEDGEIKMKWDQNKLLKEGRVKIKFKTKLII